MTEDEAKTKWCPLGRQMFGAPYSPDGAAINRPVNAAPDCSCIGSACMAWRWEHIRNADRPKDYVEQGYCGLAGKP